MCLTNVVDVLNMLFDMDDKATCTKTIYLLWHIWKSRCSWIFEQTPIHISTLINSAASLSEELIGNDAVGEPQHEKTTYVVRWKRLV
jgi:hypothetical protein